MLRPQRPGHWLVAIRGTLALVALVTVAVTTFPPRYAPWAWSMVAFFVLWAAASAAIAAIEIGPAGRVRARLLGVVLDGVIAVGFVAVFSFQSGEPYRSLYLIPVAAAGLRFGVVGGLLGGAIMVGSTVVVDALGPGNIWRAVAVRAIVGLMAGLVIGRLRDGLVVQQRTAEERAAEAERLRDELGRRVNVLETANRCARALASSLEIEQAFGAFIRELREVVPFERTAIVLIDGDEATTMATAGAGALVVFPTGHVGPLRGSVLERVLADGRLVVRRDLAEQEYAEDKTLVELGLRSELVAPLLIGSSAIGMLTLSRQRVNAFDDEEIELVALLGRLVATAVQNIRAYEAERSRGEELRQLSALRADFISMVSHELRSPLAAVIGAARTLQDRWERLSEEQRHAFLALIADETSRLAALVGDVLDTSRIEAGSFSYRFGDVDLRRLVGDSVDAAGYAQQEVRIVAEIDGELPAIRGDRERLRQVLGNLIDNAVKYSPHGGEVRVHAAAENGSVRIAVSDSGPGIPAEQQARIFEKFGRADVPGLSKPGTGLGLFISREIVVAHGGSLEVRSAPDEGATFTLTLPLPAG